MTNYRGHKECKFMLSCNSVFLLHCFQAPVQLFTLEGRYATALYSAATKKKALAQVEKDLGVFNVSSIYKYEYDIHTRVTAWALLAALSVTVIHECNNSLFVAIAMVTNNELLH